MTFSYVFFMLTLSSALYIIGNSDVKCTLKLCLSLFIPNTVSFVPFKITIYGRYIFCVNDFNKKKEKWKETKSINNEFFLFFLALEKKTKWKTLELVETCQQQYQIVI